MKNYFVSYNNYRNNILNETYESFIELKKLAHDIYAKFEQEKLKPNHLYFLKETTTREYDEIKEFVNAPVGVIYLAIKGEVVRASYVPIDQYFDDMGKFLKVNMTLQELKDTYPAGIILIFVNNLHTVIHELQHAYDNFRAKGKMLATKMAHRYNKKHDKIIASKSSSKEKDDMFYDDEYLKTYYRTPHEMSAYFVKALNEISFFEDANEMILRSFKDIYEEFQDVYQGYEYLTPKDKRRLVRKLSQYYHKIKERKIYEE